MDERDLEPEEPCARLGVDQIRARVRQLRQRRAEVADLVRDVVHPRAALRQKAPDGSVLPKRLQQLHTTVANAKRRGAHPLVVDRRPMLDLGAEEPLVRRERVVEVVNGDTKMMNPPRVHPREAIRQQPSRAATNAGE
jgi:hypothetical protein